MKTNLKPKFETINKNSVISHAFLIYDVDFFVIEKDLENIIKKYLIKNCTSLRNNMDIHIVETEKNNITKEQILDLQKSISKKSMVNENIVYIIASCEKMNLSAANCLLKNLEEPANNVYAFLVTNNIEKVLPTIRSRCMLLKINDIILPIEEVYEEKIINIAIEMIEILEKNLLKNQKKLYEKVKNLTRDEFCQIFETINFYYKDLFNLKSNRKLEYFKNYKELFELNTFNNEEKIIKKIMLLNNESKKLYYNVNINLFLDNFIIKFERCNNG